MASVRTLVKNIAAQLVADGVLTEYTIDRDGESLCCWYVDIQPRMFWLFERPGGVSVRAPGDDSEGAVPSYLWIPRLIELIVEGVLPATSVLHHSNDEVFDSYEHAPKSLSAIDRMLTSDILGE